MASWLVSWFPVASLLRFSYCITASVMGTERLGPSLSQLKATESCVRGLPRFATASVSGTAWVRLFDLRHFCWGTTLNQGLCQAVEIQSWKVIVLIFKMFLLTMRRQTCKQVQNPKLIIPTWYVQGQQEKKSTYIGPGASERTSSEGALSWEKEPKFPMDQGASSSRRTQCTVTLWTGKQLSPMGT